jgi:hypothetical protein
VEAQVNYETLAVDGGSAQLPISPFVDLHQWHRWKPEAIAPGAPNRRSMGTTFCAVCPAVVSTQFGHDAPLAAAAISVTE